LNRVPAEARIAIVLPRSSGRESAPSSSGANRESQSRLTSAATIIIPPEEVREKFLRVKPLKEISVTQRGWTLDVLNILRRLVSVFATLRRDESEGRAPRDQNPVKIGRRGTPPSDSFTTADADAFTRELEKLLRQPACAGQDSPTIAGVARHGFVIAPWSWRMEIALAPSGVESL
jgi:hypothetical protein